MKQFGFHKDGKMDQRFSMTGEEVKEKFAIWLHSKDTSFLTYHGGFQIMQMFLAYDLKCVCRADEVGQLYEDYCFGVYWNHMANLKRSV